MILDRAAHAREYRKTRAYDHARTSRLNERKAWFKALKAKLACVDCGYNAHTEALDFDHIEPTNKTHNVASMVCNNFSKEKILAEIAKCEVVCANCHRVRTANRRMPA